MTTMAIKVRQDLVSPSKYNIKAPYSMVAESITIHNTWNDASAESEVEYMKGNNKEVSFHAAIDDKEVVQAIPYNRNAWHAGDSGKGNGNRKSIGIEICYSKSGGERYKKAEALTVKYVAQLLYERKWTTERVKTHKSWTEIGVKKGYSGYVKNCPHRILDENRWNSFITAIQKELTALKTPAPKAEPVKVVVKTPVAVKTPAKAPANSTNTTYTVKKGDTLSEVAEKYKITVAKIKELNKLKSDVIQIGQKLKVPAANAPKYYVVKSGDSMSEIAADHKMELKKLLGLNPSIKDASQIDIGQKIRVS